MDQPPAEKWYCPCGQANASAFQACVNCGAPAGDGMDVPPSVEESLASGRPLAPARYMGVIAKRMLERIHISTLPYKVTVTEIRLVEWIVFILIFVCMGLGAWAIENAINRQSQQDTGVPWVTLCTLVIAFAIGSVIAFPHLQITINGPVKECTIDKRWLMFSYARRTFSLDEYFATTGLRTIHVVVDKNGGAAALLALAFGFLGHIAGEFVRNREKVDVNYRTLVVTSGPQGERWELAAFKKDADLDRILDHVREMIPERVLAEQ
jgi:hypothetical protein